MKRYYIILLIGLLFAACAKDEAGVKKEYIVMDKENGMPYKKDFYVYDNNGKIKERTIEIWNDLKGWVYYAKFEYKYTNDRTNDVLYTKWDHSKKRWSDKSELTTFLYNEDGKYLASEKASVNNNELITQK